MHSIYLDNNATTAVLPEVAAAMDEACRQQYANPASQHAAGRRARAVLEAAREGVGELLGAEMRAFQSDRVLFTSGGTESNHLAIRGLCHGKPGRVVISAMEHPSVVGATQHLAAQGWQIDRLTVDSTGLVQMDELATLLTPDTRLVSVMLGNNETGAIQPVRGIAEQCAEHEVLLHTDAVQAVGKQPVHFRELHVHALSAAAHKFHGPNGIGVLIVRHGITVAPLMQGGFQQGAIRPGTESVVLAVGMHKALALWEQRQKERTSHLAHLRDRLELALLEGARNFSPVLPIVINAAGSPRLPHTTNIAFPGLDRQTLVMALDLAGVACSTGSACASGSSEPSTTLIAMGLAGEVIRGSLRFSVGELNTLAEIDLAASRILHVAKDLWRQESLRKMPATPPAALEKPV